MNSNEMNASQMSKALRCSSPASGEFQHFELAFLQNAVVDAGRHCWLYVDLYKVTLKALSTTTFLSALHPQSAFITINS